MQLTLHATRSTPHGASRLVQAMSAWSAETGRAPSRHCRDARVYGHTTDAWHEYTPSPNGGIIGTYRMTDLRMYTVVRAYPNFATIPGDPETHVTIRTSRHTLKRFYDRSVPSEIQTRTHVLDDVNRCEGVTCWAIGIKDRSITQPRATVL